MYISEARVETRIFLMISELKKYFKPVEWLFDPKIATVIFSIFLSTESIFWISPPVKKNYKCTHGFLQSSGYLNC